MHRISRRVVAVGLALATVVGVAGCSLPSSPVAEGTATPTATPTPTDSEARVEIDFGSAPNPAAQPSCSALLPEGRVAAVVPGVRPTDLLVEAAHIGGPEAFVAAAGGVVCVRSNGVAPLDDAVPGQAGDTLFEGVRLSVLPGGRSAHAEHIAFDGQGAAPGCSASDSARVYCGADLVAGGAWVSLSSTRLQDDADATPEAAQPAFDALVGDVVERVEGSSLGRVPDVGTDDDGSITACDAGRVNAVTDHDLDVGPFPNSSTAPEVEDFARNRVGGDTCVFVGTAGAYPTADALFVHLPDGGWIAERRLGSGAVDDSDRIDLPGLAGGDAAWRTCDDGACSIDVVRDGDWTHYLLFDRAAPDASAAVERWVRASFTR